MKWVRVCPLRSPQSPTPPKLHWLPVITAASIGGTALSQQNRVMQNHQFIQSKHTVWWDTSLMLSENWFFFQVFDGYRGMMNCDPQQWHLAHKTWQRYEVKPNWPPNMYCICHIYRYRHDSKQGPGCSHPLVEWAHRPMGPEAPCHHRPKKCHYPLRKLLFCDRLTSVGFCPWHKPLISLPLTPLFRPHRCVKHALDSLCGSEEKGGRLKGARLSERHAKLEVF